MSGPGRSGADDLLATALAGGASLTDAASLAGVSPRTVRRRLRDPAFRRRLQRLRDNLTSQAIGLLSRHAAKAVDVLAKELDSKNVKHRIGSAKTLLQLLLRGRELVDLQDRVADLEGSDEDTDHDLEGAVEEAEGDGDEDDAATP